MSPVATPARSPEGLLFGAGTRRGEMQLFESAGSTLEDLVLGAWEDLATAGRARCPVCSGELEVRGCRSCGSELS